MQPYEAQPHDAEPGDESDDTTPHDRLEEWKQSMRDDLEEWLDGITELPEEEIHEDEESPQSTTQDELEEPDLHSFFTELSASNAESKKANRRIVDAFGQWGETLSKFETALQELQRRLDATPKQESGASKSQILTILEIRDRVDRLHTAFANRPPAKRGFFGNTAEWEAAWQRQADAARMLLETYHAFLTDLGLRRIHCVGQAFDPRIMMAMDAGPRESPESTGALRVSAELSPGWFKGETLLRAAQVKLH